MSNFLFKQLDKKIESWKNNKEICFMEVMMILSNRKLIDPSFLALIWNIIIIIIKPCTGRLHDASV